LRIGIAFDLAPTGPAALQGVGPDDQFEEFDKPETVEAITAVLRGRGHEVILLGDGPEFLRAVLDDPPELVWNMAEGQGVGRCREARVPAALEMLGIPYTGSDPLTLAATLDKHVAKRLVSIDNAVRVPEGIVLSPGLERKAFLDLLDGVSWSFPVILKPSFEGSSKGIRSHCLVPSREDAWKTYTGLSRDYHQAILIEEFIEGDELTVGLIGNDGASEVVGAMRIVPKSPDVHFVYSLEVKRDWRRRVDYEAPASLSHDLHEKVHFAADFAYGALGCRDLARIDFRVRSGVPYFIEANPLPGLAPVTSDLVILAKGHGIEYDDLIGRIFEAALARLGLEEHFPGTSRR
jgi:D-alanine-D-alanine ligase